MMSQANPLKGFIYQHFGNYQDLARHLRVSTSTVTDWVGTCPRNMLKYLPELTELADVDYAEVVEAVMRREQQIL